MTNFLLDLVIAFGVAIPIIAAAITAAAASVRLHNEWKKRKILSDESAKQFVSQYNENEIRLAVSGYLTPKCSPGDPANKDKEAFLSDMRESIYTYMDRSIAKQSRSYHLILADTGMGKTAFCINYFYRLRKRKNRVCLVSLASDGFVTYIKNITAKQECILILDAFDEYAAGKEDGHEAFMELIKQCEDFKSVIVTCRSQYFQGEDFIPRETPLPDIRPKGLNASSNFSLVRSYISPFDDKEIATYISKHFPFWKFWNFKTRRKAYSLAKEVPDLAHRPMLLEYLPELVKNREWSNELYDLYSLLVDGWLDREKNWIDSEKLLKASFEIAYNFTCVEKIDRLSKNRIQNIVEKALGLSPSWKHLSTRSLLNCDSKGRYKFAHRSILEYLLVRMAIEGDYRSLDAKWTPFMKELLVSWGHKSDDMASVQTARTILSDPRSRENLYPLYEIWLGKNAFPYLNLDSLLARRTTSDGYRLAPLAWRQQGLEVSEKPTMWKIEDNEFNIKWRFIKDNLFHDQNIKLTISEAEKIVDNNSRIRFPYLDEMVALLDGLHLAGNDLIENGDTFILSDKPSSREKVVLVVGLGIKGQSGIKQVGKTRAIRGDGYKIGMYVTGISYSTNYHRRKVRQLYVETK